MPLNKADYAYLHNAYQAARDTPTGSTITGNHWLLIAALNRLGYSVNGLEEAYRIAEQLLWSSY